VVPAYRGIERLAATGDAVGWGGRHRCTEPAWRGRLTPLQATVPDLADGQFVVTTRRGKQFNSIVHGALDPLTGAARDAVFIDAGDATALGLDDGDPVRLRSEVGVLDGYLRVVRLPPRSLQVHWPEGNALIPAGPRHREPGSKVPAYEAVVTIERR
jgi:anaerobic selenocysteine-containing dehydrogenase